MPQTQETILQHPAQFTSRRVQPISDDFEAWIAHYLEMAVIGIRTTNNIQKIRLHLRRFADFFAHQYGHSKISTLVKRDILLWQKALLGKDLAHATVNSHISSVSGFTSWIYSHNKELWPHGNPTTGISELSLPPLEPKTLGLKQIQSLKSLCDRLSHFYKRKGRKWQGVGGRRASARPLRDRAIIFVLLSTGLRREELVRLDLEQLGLDDISTLREVKRCRLSGIRGKGKTLRHVFLSLDARLALADYLENERPMDMNEDSVALFLSAKEVSARQPDGRLSVRAINNLVEQIGRWHDSEMTSEDRKISPLHPHALRHTFAFQLSKATDADSYELERRLGHRSQRYISWYTNPPEDIAASYIETF